MLITSIDIGVDSKRSSEQKKNFESLIQTLQLRTQIEPIITVKTSNKKINNMFADLTDRDPVWIIYFNVDQGHVYEHELESINADLDYIPCITGLEESRRNKNSYFKATSTDFNSRIIKHQLISGLDK